MPESGGPSDKAGFKPDEFGIGRLFEATADAIVLIDVRGSILGWNRSAERIFGYERDEIVGKNVDVLVPPEYLKRHHEGMDRYARTRHGKLIDSGRPYEVPALHKDGSRVVVDLTLSRITQHGDDYVLAILRDVNERVLMRERSEAERKQLAQAVESLEAFTYVVGHDLKEPVRGMAAILDELQEDPASPARPELIARAVEANRNLQHLLEGLLDWSRTSMTPLEPRPLMLSDVLRSPGCAAQWKNLARERGAEVDIARDMPCVLATEDLICRVFGNVITNAIRHNPKPRPRVKVRGEEKDGETVELVVEDDGPGFPPELIARVQRLKSRPTTIRGGFGLAITRLAVDRLRGSMSLANAPGGGAVVRVRLPASKPAGDDR